MPTLVEFDSLEQNIELCKKLGLNFIELNLNLPVFTPEYLSSNELRHLSENHEIEFTIHLPEELDLSSFHPSIRKGHIERCKQIIDWANHARIKTINMHLNNGIYFTLPDKKVWINEKYEEQFMRLLFESYSQLFDQLSGTQLCIENTGNFQIPFVNKALDMLLRFEDLSLTWDVGHDGKSNFQEEAYFVKHIDRIRHMHLHDYNGVSDHQPLYTGKVPINDRLQLARDKNLSVVIEVKTSSGLQESINELQKNLA